MDGYGFGDWQESYSLDEVYGLAAGRHGIPRCASDGADYYIDVVMNVDVYTARAAYLTIDQTNVPPSQKVDDDQLANYQDLVDRVYEYVSSKFKVVRERQSNESQSYYIDFEPSDGIVARIRFRISLHDLNKGSEFITPDFALKSFTVNGLDYASVGSVVNAVGSLCSDISNGDYSAWERS